MQKKITQFLRILSFLYTGVLFAQNQDPGAPIMMTNALDGSLFNFLQLNSNGGTSGQTRVDYAIIKIPKLSPKAQGTIYRYKGYQNKGSLILDDKSFDLDNINFNVLTNTIESKVSKDSVFVFDLQNVDKATINKEIFKSVWINSGKRIVEVVYEDDVFTLVKNYRVDIRAKEASSDPLMVKKQGNAVFVREVDFWIRKEDLFDKIRLNKKSITKLFSGKENEIKKFVKKNRLSYRKEKDIKKILEYGSSL